jgi:hypothetical protein
MYKNILLSLNSHPYQSLIIAPFIDLFYHLFSSLLFLNTHDQCAISLSLFQIKLSFFQSCSFLSWLTSGSSNLTALFRRKPGQPPGTNEKSSFWSRHFRMTQSRLSGSNLCVVDERDVFNKARMNHHWRLVNNKHIYVSSTQWHAKLCIM